MDQTFELDCGCEVAWDHGAWSWDLTYTGNCTHAHSTAEAIAIAEALR